jgi:ubiquinone/menaquinone biosynthesis C-methylase UbiE
MKKVVRKYALTKIQTVLRKLYYGFPFLRKIYYLPADFFRFIFQGKKLIPPRSKIFVGDSDFEKTGQEFLNYFVKYGNLCPNQRILEVGSGIGRMAIPLTGYLDSEGSYEGIDIVEEGIRWCQKRITPKYNNFNFQISDVYNDLYHRSGNQRASEYRFPFADNQFDFVFLTSVFTHMLPLEVLNYLTEIQRVLKKGGISFVTFFLLDKTAWKYVKSDMSRFNYDFEGCRVIDPAIPGASIAFDEKQILAYYNRTGFKINHPILYGKWAKREEFVSYQDIIISEKI